uniref:Gag protein n=1 Tax=Ditylenchus dipsaci TaxID=166011 RepID=A0A915CMT6_9BILA
MDVDHFQQFMAVQQQQQAAMAQQQLQQQQHQEAMARQQEVLSLWSALPYRDRSVLQVSRSLSYAVKILGSTYGKVKASLQSSGPSRRAASEIQQIYASPQLSQSDGQAESFVDTFKRAINKIKREGIGQKAIDKLIVCYRNAPCSATPDGKSPAEAFFGPKWKENLQ